MRLAVAIFDAFMLSSTQNHNNKKKKVMFTKFRETKVKRALKRSKGFSSFRGSNVL